MTALNTSSLVHLPACFFSGRVISLSHTCLAKLLLPCHAYCCPVLLLPYSIPVCRQKSCPSWVLKRVLELEQLLGRVRREEGSVLHWESRWAWVEEPGLTWEGEEGRSSLLEQAFRSCFCSSWGNTTGLRSEFLYFVLMPPMFCLVLFLIFQDIFPEKFCNALWETC